MGQKDAYLGGQDLSWACGDVSWDYWTCMESSNQTLQQGRAGHVPDPEFPWRNEWWCGQAHGGAALEQPPRAARLAQLGKQ